MRAGKLIDIAFDAIETGRNLFGHPVVRQSPLGEMLESCASNFTCASVINLREIGHLADFPEQHHPFAARSQRGDVGIAGELAQGQVILAFLLANEAGDRRATVQAAQKALDARNRDRRCAMR